MSIIGDLFKAVFGGAPSVSGAAASTTRDSQKAAGAVRASLYETEGGIMGDELQEGEVKRRPTLFGN